jgi:hypothetical protein
LNEDEQGKRGSGRAAEHTHPATQDHPKRGATHRNVGCGHTGSQAVAQPQAHAAVGGPLVVARRGRVQEREPEGHQAREPLHARGHNARRDCNAGRANRIRTCSHRAPAKPACGGALAALTGENEAGLQGAPRQGTTTLHACAHRCEGIHESAAAGVVPGAGWEHQQGGDAHAQAPRPHLQAIGEYRVCASTTAATTHGARRTQAREWQHAPAKSTEGGAGEE